MINIEDLAFYAGLEKEQFINELLNYFFSNEEIVSKMKERLKPKDEELNIIIEDFMVQLGVVAHYEGWNEIRESIKYCLCLNDYSDLKMGNLYNEIGKKLGITPHSTERRIRETVDRVYKRNLPFLEEIYGYPDYNKEKIVNTEFIVGATRYIRKHILNSDIQPRKSDNENIS